MKDNIFKIPVEVKKKKEKKTFKGDKKLQKLYGKMIAALLLGNKYAENSEKTSSFKNALKAHELFAERQTKFWEVAFKKHPEMASITTYTYSSARNLFTED